MLRECSLFMGRGVGSLANGRGGKRSLLPYLGGGREVLLSIWGRGGGGGQKSLRVDIISFGFFLILPEPHDI